MNQAHARVIERKKRSFRIRKKIAGRSDRPRLCVRRSLNHIYAQIINDEDRTSVVQVGSSAKDLAEKIAQLEKRSKTDISRLVGEVIAEKAKEKGIQKVVFDRKGYRYHGRVRALAEGARAGGLEF
ncbi:MAG: 50S ribosomal protein L18 [Chitinivibrionales bacterium]|nr:50S ribosomal protein L18 [Chitinivibrionales bacterium]